MEEMGTGACTLSYKCRSKRFRWVDAEFFFATARYDSLGIRTNSESIPTDGAIGRTDADIASSIAHGALSASAVVQKNAAASVTGPKNTRTRRRIAVTDGTIATTNGRQAASARGS